MRREDYIPAGEMTARITLRGTALDANDQWVIGSPIAENVPARKQALRAREIFEAGRDAAEMWTEFRIRWRAGLDTVARIEHDGQDYNVDAVVDPTGNRRVLVLTARAVR